MDNVGRPSAKERWRVENLHIDSLTVRRFGTAARRSPVSSLPMLRHPFRTQMFRNKFEGCGSDPWTSVHVDGGASTHVCPLSFAGEIPIEIVERGYLLLQCALRTDSLSVAVETKILFLRLCGLMKAPRVSVRFIADVRRQIIAEKPLIQRGFRMATNRKSQGRISVDTMFPSSASRRTDFIFSCAGCCHRVPRIGRDVQHRQDHRCCFLHVHRQRHGHRHHNRRA